MVIYNGAAVVDALQAVLAADLSPDVWLLLLPALIAEESSLIRVANDL
jgi:hypothetical protein